MVFNGFCLQYTMIQFFMGNCYMYTTHCNGFSRPFLYLPPPVPAALGPFSFGKLYHLITYYLSLLCPLYFQFHLNNNALLKFVCQIYFTYKKGSKDMHIFYEWYRFALLCSSGTLLCLYITHSSADGHIRLFQGLAVVNCAVIKINVHMSL